MRRSMAALVGLAFVVGCKETAGPIVPDPDPDPGNGPTPALAVLVSPSSVTAPQGGSQTVAIALTRSGGFIDAIELSLEDVPNGVTATLQPATVPSGGSASSIAIAVGGAAPPGSHVITVHASGNGVTEKTATFTLVITEVLVPGFTLAVTPTNLSIQQGRSATSVLTVTRTGGFTGSISLTVGGAPAGVNAIIDPPLAVDVPSTLTVGATFNAPTGTYTLTVRASATGQADRTVDVTVVVTSSNPTGNVSWQFCAASGIPVWLAYQDGTGTWVRVSPTNNVFAFDLASAVGGIAWVLATQGGGYDLNVFYGTRSDLNARGLSLCAGSGVTRTVNGSVAGLGASEQAWIDLAGASAVVNPALGTAFTIANVLDGPFDLLASRIAVGGGGSLTLNRMLLRRGLNPANGTTLAPLDFAGAESFNPAGGSVTIANLGSDQTRIVASYYAANRQLGAYYADAQPVGGAVRTFGGVPAGVQATGDLHVLTLLATAAGVATPATTRSATMLFRTAGGRSVTMGPPISNVNVTAVASSPYARLGVQYPIQIEYNTFWSLGAVQTGIGQERTVTVSVTAAYFGTVSVVDIVVPDFNGTAGWDAVYGPRSGVATTWTLNVSGWLAAGGVDRPPFQDGVVWLSATRTGQITP